MSELRQLEVRGALGSLRPEVHADVKSRYDLSTIMGIKVDEVEIPEAITQMADAYLEQLAKEGANQAQLAELAYAFRRQLQTDLSAIKSENGQQEEETPPEDSQKGSLTKRLRTKLLKTDETHAFSLAVYRKLLAQASQTLQTELARHEKERQEINGSYEEYKNSERDIEETRGKLIGLLTEMFKVVGQDVKPVHLAKRALLETRLEDLEVGLQAIKGKNPDVAALVEYDTVHEYAKQFRDNGFVWTRSRQKLLQDVLTGALTSRPVAALMGETGTGKTALARSAAVYLSSRDVERDVGGEAGKFERLLAVVGGIKDGETYYNYGPLLRAITGKASSIDTNPSQGGGIFFDDEFNTRPTSVQRQILKFVSEARTGRRISVPGTTISVTVAPGFLYLAAGNPPSERYDREETGIETRREFGGNVLNVEYLEQTAENPELYQVLLAALLDRSTGRLTAVTSGEVVPEWKEVDANTGESHLETDPTSGAFLWRFSNAWGELFKAFSHQDTVLHAKNSLEPKASYHLSTFILDPGVVLDWIGLYKKSPKARKEHLASFVLDHLVKYLSQFPEEEQKIVEMYLNHFGIALSVPVGRGADVKRLRAIHQREASKPLVRVLTPKEIGYLNPNVPRPIKKHDVPPVDSISPLIDEHGDTIGNYVRVPALGIEPDSNLSRRSDVADTDVSERITFLGVGYDETRKTMDQNTIFVRALDGAIKQYASETFKRYFLPETPPPPPPPPEVGELVPFAYDSIKAREYGFSELKIEVHREAQKIVDAIHTRDPRFVTIHRAGSPDPDSTTTPPALLTADKIKLNEAALRAAWSADCSDLNDSSGASLPEKSLWYFQAIAEHRLSNTIDNDDPNNLINSSKPHIHGFGQKSFLLAMDFQEFDWDNATEKTANITPQTKKILKTLFNKEDPTSITRDEVNTALWSDHENRIQSDTAKQVIRVLLGSSANPDDYELRLMRPDEYVRAATAQGYGQQNLWTHMDGYYARGGGFRYGLGGGDRDGGGAAGVGGGQRGGRGGGLAVRLVLSRKV